MDDEKKIELLGWINTASWEQKYDFFRQMLGTLPPNEVKSLENMTKKMRRVAKIKPQGDEPVPVSEPVPPPCPVLMPIEKGWWSKWDPKDIVAFDCEHVHLKDVSGTGRIKAATCGIYDGNFQIVEEYKIKHVPYSYIVNEHTKKANGFTQTSLQNGIELEAASEDVKTKFKGKLVLHFDGVKDFLSLNLNPGDFDNFDLAHFYRKPSYTKYGENVGEKIGLRTLIWHFFGEDPQSGIHSATTDAYYTMKLFLEHYVKINNGNESKFHVDYDLFKDINKFTP